MSNACACISMHDDFLKRSTGGGRADGWEECAGEMMLDCGMQAAGQPEKASVSVWLSQRSHSRRCRWRDKLDRPHWYVYDIGSSQMF